METESRELAEALAHYATGLLLEAEEGRQSPGALRHYAWAAELIPGQHRLYAKVAASALVQGRPEQAIASLEKSIAATPDSFAARIDLASAYQLLGNREQAIVQFQKAFKLDPARPALYGELGGLLFDSGRDAEALALFEKGLTLDPEGPQIRALLYSFGLRLIQKGEPLRAIPCFERLAPFADKRGGRIWSLIGQLCEVAEVPERARRAYRQAIVDPEAPPEAYLRLAALTAPADADAAVAVLKQAAQAAAPERPLPLTATTVNVAISMVVSAPSNVVSLLEAANRQLPAAEAIPIMDAVIQIAALAAETDPPEAIAFLETIRAQWPDEPLPLLVLGQLYGRSERHAEALACFDQLWQGDADKADTNLFTDVFYLLYGAAAERGGDLDKAAAIFEDGLQRFPDAHEVLNYLAYMRAEQGLQLEQALVQVNRALELVPDSAAYLDTRGWIHYQRRNFEAALADIQAANMLYPGDPTITDHLGDVWLALGRPELAVQFWMASQRLTPSDTVKAKIEAHADAAVEKGLSDGNAPPAFPGEASTSPAPATPPDPAPDEK